MLLHTKHYACTSRKHQYEVEEVFTKSCIKTERFLETTATPGCCIPNIKTSRDLEGKVTRHLNHTCIEYLYSIMYLHGQISIQYSVYNYTENTLLIWTVNKRSRPWCHSMTLHGWLGSSQYSHVSYSECWEQKWSSCYCAWPTLAIILLDYKQIMFYGHKSVHVYPGSKVFDIHC